MLTSIISPSRTLFHADQQQTATDFCHFTPDVNSRVPPQHFDTQTQCIMQQHSTPDNCTRLASLRGTNWSSALASSRGRRQNASNGSHTSSNTDLNLDQLSLFIFLPVSDRQLYLPHRSVRQAAFLPQVQAGGSVLLRHIFSCFTTTE
jgi:hypothetical protein